MEQFENILARIELALTLGDEPSDEALSQNNITLNEYNELITLNSMIENDIELIRIYGNNDAMIMPIDLLRQNYINGYYPLLEEFGLAEHLPRITR